MHVSWDYTPNSLRPWTDIIFIALPLTYGKKGLLDLNSIPLTALLYCDPQMCFKLHH